MQALVILTLLFFSCLNQKGSNSETEQETISDHWVQKLEFQSIIDSANVKGSILIYDIQKDVFYSNDFEWANRGFLPASTYKIINSIIALECGVVEDDSTLFKWDGKKRAIKNWEQDLIFRDAFHFSCVPCYQGVARRVGEKRMNEYLSKLDYGNIRVDSNNIDVFWLEGDSRISQFQQIDFLNRFHESKLPISERTEKIMRRMMVIEDTVNYRLSGKTGWSVRDGVDNGWFVGYIEMGTKVYFFATNVEPEKKFNMDMFPVIRKDVTFSALKQIEKMQ